MRSALLVGSAVLLAAGLPFRLSQQHWRFTGVNDLLSVSASAIVSWSGLLWLRPWPRPPRSKPNCGIFSTC